jgi:hypothetical protein
MEATTVYSDFSPTRCKWYVEGDPPILILKGVSHTIKRGFLDELDGVVLKPFLIHITPLILHK